MAYSPDGAHLAVGLDSGGLHVLDARTLERLAWRKEAASGMEDLKYSPSGRLLAGTSHSELAVDVYDRQAGYRRVARCLGHSGAVMHLDWSVDSRFIQSSSSSYELLVHDAASGRVHKGTHRDTQWATYTCLLGFPVMGIWPPDSDGTDVNAVDRSPSGKYLATADDYGSVKLFNYPCVVRHAPFQARCRA